MADGITHSNKDVLFKALSRCYGNKSFAVYGLDLPRIKTLLPNNYPGVTATEIYADSAFLLADNSLLILEYESSPTKSDFIKYNKYIINLLEYLSKEGIDVNNVIVVVIYTGDIKSSAHEFNVGALRVQVQQVFLSNADTNGIYTDIKTKIESGEPLNDDDIMNLIILPLTQPDKTQKQKLIEDTISLAKQIPDTENQMFVLAGILTATDKFIEREYANQIREWISMTQVARLYEEEKIEAVNRAVRAFEKEKIEAVNTAVIEAVIEAARAFEEEKVEALKQDRLRAAKDMLSAGFDILNVMKFTMLTRAELEAELSVS